MNENVWWNIGVMDITEVDATHSSVHCVVIQSSTQRWLLAVAFREVFVLMMALYCNTVAFVIVLWLVFFLNAGDIKRVEQASACPVAEMGDDLPKNSNGNSILGGVWLLMLKNSKCSLFVERYRPHERMWSGSSISVYNRGERKFVIPFCFTLYSELRLLWKGHCLPKDCTYTGALLDVGLGMCYRNSGCSCSETAWQLGFNLFFFVKKGGGLW